MAALASRYRFDSFEIDAATRELLQDGERLDVQPKVFDLVLHLIEHRDRVVPRKELVAALWPDAVVGDNSVSQALAAARKTLCDPADAPRLIETVRGRGLRFVGEVHSDEPPAPATDRGDPFVGRSRVLSGLRQQLEQSLGGQSRLALLVGEPGIGKTRTAETLRPEVEGSGGRFLVGRCREGEGAPPFWPWLQILRQLDSDAARALVGRVLDGDPSGSRGLGALRFDLFDAVAGALAEEARRAPLAILLDDLHCADPDSVALLMHVAGQLQSVPLLLLGTLRDTALDDSDARTRNLSELLARDPLRVHALRGLEPEELVTLTEAITGQTPDREQAGRLWEQTGGNPLFARHLLSLGDRAGGSGGEIPEGIRSAIRHHLGFLPASCREPLEAAAVLGREFDADVLVRMTGIPMAALLDALEPAVRGRVLERCADGRLRFAHGLIFEVLEAGLGAARRAELHGKAADELLRASPRSPEAAAAAIAHHLATAIPVLGAERALSARRRAATVARERLAYAEAADHLEQALALLELDPGLDSERSVLLVELGDVLWRSGQGDRARRAFFAARDAAREEGRPELEARAVLALGDWWDGQPIPALYEAALAALGPRPSALRARLLARIAREIREHTPADQVEAQAGEAVAMARDCGDPGALAYALLCHHYAVWKPDDLAPRLARAKEAMQVATDAGDPELALRNAHFVMIDQLEAGEHEAMYQTMERAQPWHDGLRQAQLDWARSLFLGALALRAGRVAEAAVLIEQAREVGSGVQPAATGAFHAMQRFALARLVGPDGSEAVRAPALPASETGRVESHPLLLLGKICSALGEGSGSGDADHRLADELASRTPELARDVAYKSALYLGAELAARLEHRELAECVYTALLPLRGSAALLGYSAAYLGPVDMALALCADVVGRFDAAEEHFQAARAFEERGVHPGHAALTEMGLQWAERLARRADAADHARAADLATESAERARTLGLSRIEARARAVRNDVAGVTSLESARERRRSSGPG